MATKKKKKNPNGIQTVSNREEIVRQELKDKKVNLFAQVNRNEPESKVNTEEEGVSEASWENLPGYKEFADRVPHLNYNRLLKRNFAKDKENFAICLPSVLGSAICLLDAIRNKLFQDIHRFISQLLKYPALYSKSLEPVILVVMLNGNHSDLFYKAQISRFWTATLTLFVTEIICKSTSLPYLKNGLLDAVEDEELFFQMSSQAQDVHITLNALCQYEGKQLPTCLMDFLSVFEYEDANQFHFPLSSSFIEHFEKLINSEISEKYNANLLSAIRYVFYPFVKKYFKRLHLIKGEMLSQQILHCVDADPNTQKESPSIEMADVFDLKYMQSKDIFRPSSSSSSSLHLPNNVSSAYFRFIDHFYFQCYFLKDSELFLFSEGWEILFPPQNRIGFSNYTLWTFDIHQSFKEIKNYHPNGIKEDLFTFIYLHHLYLLEKKEYDQEEKKKVIPYFMQNLNRYLKEHYQFYQKIWEEYFLYFLTVMSYTKSNDLEKKKAEYEKKKKSSAAAEDDVVLCIEQEEKKEQKMLQGDSTSFQPQFTDRKKKNTAIEKENENPLIAPPTRNTSSEEELKEDDTIRLNSMNISDAHEKVKEVQRQKAEKIKEAITNSLYKEVEVNIQRDTFLPLVFYKSREQADLHNRTYLAPFFRHKLFQPTECIGFVSKMKVFFENKTKTNLISFSSEEDSKTKQHSIPSSPPSSFSSSSSSSSASSYSYKNSISDLLIENLATTICYQDELFKLNDEKSVNEEEVQTIMTIIQRYFLIEGGKVPFEELLPLAPGATYRLTRSVNVYGKVIPANTLVRFLYMTPIEHKGLSVEVDDDRKRKIKKS